MAGVLYVRAMEADGSARRDLLDRAERIAHCHIPKPDEGIRENSCKDRMCPAFMTNRYSLPNKAKLVAMFEHVPLELLWEFRFGLGPVRTLGADLADASAEIRHDFLLLRQSRVWGRIFESYGAVVHQPWKFASKKYPDDGFVVHIHVIAQARPGKVPDLDAIRDAHRKRIGLPKSTRAKDFFHGKQVEDLEATAGYITKIEKYLPGYDVDKSGAIRDRRRFIDRINKIATGHISMQKPRLIERMPIEDIMRFLDATENSKRLMLGGCRAFRLAGAGGGESPPGWDYR
jgi:hypothetical protein